MFEITTYTVSRQIGETIMDSIVDAISNGGNGDYGHYVFESLRHGYDRDLDIALSAINIPHLHEVTDEDGDVTVTFISDDNSKDYQFIESEILASDVIKAHKEGDDAFFKTLEEAEVKNLNATSYVENFQLTLEQALSNFVSNIGHYNAEPKIVSSVIT